MKELLAVVVALLAALIAYKVHQDKLQAARAEGIPKYVTQVNHPLSVELEFYVKGLTAKLEYDNPEDYMAPLASLRAQVIILREGGDAAKTPLYDAGLRTLDQLLPIAQQRTKIIEQVLRTAARPDASLDRKDSSNNSKTFFQQNLIKAWENQTAQRRAQVDSVMASLKQAEAATRQRLGAAWSGDNYAPRRLDRAFVSVEGSTTMNPLDRGSYDRKESESLRQKKAAEAAAASSSF